MGINVAINYNTLKASINNSNTIQISNFKYSIEPKVEFCIEYQQWLYTLVNTMNEKIKIDDWIKNYLQPKTVIILKQHSDMEILKNWATEHAKGKYCIYSTNIVIFEDNQDAIMVKLKWS
jgi:hypothetical protein